MPKMVASLTHSYKSVSSEFRQAAAMRTPRNVLEQVTLSVFDLQGKQHTSSADSKDVPVPTPRIWHPRDKQDDLNYHT